jgi:alanyl-tRNA synthetase
LTSGIDEAPALVETLAAHSRDAQSRVRRLETELAAFRARALYDGTPPDASGRRVTVDRGGAGSPDERRVFALAFCALPKAVFIALMEDPPAILLATSSDSGMDAGRTLKAVLEPLGGKGGGSPRMAQGSIPSAGALDEVARALQDRSPA